MGKQTNAQVLRFSKSEDWVSKYYVDSFNYSNLLVQDLLIREYAINFISGFNTKVAQVYIHREEHRVILRIFSYNDSFTHWSSCLMKHKKKVRYNKKRLKRSSVKHKNIFNPPNSDTKTYNPLMCIDTLPFQMIFKRDGKHLDYIKVKKYSKNIRRCTGYSGKSLLALNLSYLLKTNVIIQNTNILSNNQRHLLLKIFRPMGFRLRSPLSKFLRIKFVCLVYYSLLYKSSLLLCRYLRFIIPRFCKKRRKSRRINPFFKSLKSVIKLMFLKGFCKKAKIKGVKICIKGRINGSRRKRTYIYKKGHTSTQSFKNEVSYYQEDCLTIFGVLGIKVWIIY